MIQLFKNENIPFYAYTEDEAHTLIKDKNVSAGQLSFFDSFDSQYDALCEKKELQKEKRRLAKEKKLLEQAQQVPIQKTAMKSIFEYAQELIYTPQKRVEENLSLVNGVLKSIKYPSYLSYDELESEGRLALVIASSTFNPSLNTKFSSYAYACIRNALIKKVDKDCKFQNNKCGDIRLNSDDEFIPIAEQLPDNSVSVASEIELSVDMERALLYINERYKKRPSILIGLRALVLYAYGYKFCDIARMWGMAENHLTAIVSRTRGVFRRDERLLGLVV